MLDLSKPLFLEFEGPLAGHEGMARMKPHRLICGFVSSATQAVTDGTTANTTLSYLAG